MSQSQYSLTWEAHVKNVCDGLSSLQQNGEFVDMTLAADGHMVKVHQVVLALASPYFKELIVSAQCPHPTIFLNKVTHSTLSALLEYIYTGQVLVTLDHLNDLIEAAKELHIKGLKDMKVHPSIANDTPVQTQSADVLGEDVCLFQVTEEEEEENQSQLDNETGMQNMMQFSECIDYEEEHLSQGEISQEISQEQLMQTQDLEQSRDDDTDLVHDGRKFQNIPDEQMQEDTECNISFVSSGFNDGPSIGQVTTISPGRSALQYTVSNQGSLQIILNRFLYYLKHTNQDRSRQWRCVDYLSHSGKCPALVVTKDDLVVQRVAAHTHPFHDKRILKKLKTGAVFSVLVDAEKEGKSKRTGELPEIGN